MLQESYIKSGSDSSTQGKPQSRLSSTNDKLSLAPDLIKPPIRFKSRTKPVRIRSEASCDPSVHDVDLQPLQLLLRSFAERFSPTLKSRRSRHHTLISTFDLSSGRRVDGISCFASSPASSRLTTDTRIEGRDLTRCSAVSGPIPRYDFHACELGCYIIYERTVLPPLAPVIKMTRPVKSTFGTSRYGEEALAIDGMAETA